MRLAILRAPDLGGCGLVAGNVVEAAQPSAGSDWLVYAVRLWLLPGA